MRIKAYAKVNLALKVVNKRDDNYHNLQTIMDLIDIYDVVRIKRHNAILFECSDKNLENNNNLVLKAIDELKKYCNLNESHGAKIFLKKHIPYGAGLGGGSSDAASTLIALNKIWKLELTFEELVKIALKVGSDVPFFLLSQRGILSGIGENVNAIDSNLKLYYLLINPKYPMYTKDVYMNNKVYGDNFDSIDNMIKAFNSNFVDEVINNMFNDLTDSAISLNNDEPKIKDIIDKANNVINEYKITGKAIMSGSGSSVVCAFTNKADRDLIFNQLNNHFQSIIRAASI